MVSGSRRSNDAIESKHPIVNGNRSKPAFGSCGVVIMNIKNGFISTLDSHDTRIKADCYSGRCQKGNSLRQYYQPEGRLRAFFRKAEGEIPDQRLNALAKL